MDPETSRNFGDVADADLSGGGVYVAPQHVVRIAARSAERQRRLVEFVEQAAITEEAPETDGTGIVSFSISGKGTTASVEITESLLRDYAAEDWPSLVIRGLVAAHDAASRRRILASQRERQGQRSTP